MQRLRSILLTTSASTLRIPAAALSTNDTFLVISLTVVNAALNRESSPVMHRTDIVAGPSAYIRLDGKEEVLIDPNKLSDDGTASLGVMKFSESAELLAYGVKRSGSDWTSIRVRRVGDCADL